MRFLTDENAFPQITSHLRKSGHDVNTVHEAGISKAEDENPLDFELGRHGIYIKKGSTTGCFLPQVAIDTGWTKEEFLTQCCSTKAGMSPDAWKKGDVEVYIFTSEIISEKDVDS